MLIRRFQSGDGPALRLVFHSAIHRVASADYSPEQIAAWAPDDFDLAGWERHMQSLNPFVAVEGSEIVGYADVQKAGYIDHFYVSGHHPRHGIGTQLMHALHKEAAGLGVPELTSHVSKTAQPFFAGFGFEIVDHRSPTVRGVVVPNALMRKSLRAI